MPELGNVKLIKLSARYPDWRLDDEDRNFLRSQPGWNWQKEKHFRKSRIKIFRGYLRQLSSDFDLVCFAVKSLLVSSKVDRPDLVRLVAKQQFRFACGMASVECKLLLYRFGWINVDARALIRPLEMVCGQLHSLALVPQAAHANAGF